ncbi:hypothetical protein BJ170DRAFT_127304 [Xylariales sp. AK1849]|nr:hypothetical protein BJ170DRAFT_127304 [Xylariales sp. AK1849]
MLDWGLLACLLLIWRHKASPTNLQLTGSDGLSWNLVRPTTATYSTYLTYLSSLLSTSVHRIIYLFAGSQPLGVAPYCDRSIYFYI